MENEWANDTDRYALAAHPGKSQGPPPNLTGSQPIVHTGVPDCVLHNKNPPVPGDPLLRGRAGDSCQWDFHAPNLGSARPSASLFCSACQSHDHDAEPPTRTTASSTRPSAATGRLRRLAPQDLAHPPSRDLQDGSRHPRLDAALPCSACLSQTAEMARKRVAKRAGPTDQCFAPRGVVLAEHR